MVSGDTSFSEGEERHPAVEIDGHGSSESTETPVVVQPQEEHQCSLLSLLGFHRSLSYPLYNCLCLLLWEVQSRPLQAVTSHGIDKFLLDSSSDWLPFSQQ